MYRRSKTCRNGDFPKYQYPDYQKINPLDTLKQGAWVSAAVGGAGAILSKCIKKSTVIAYDDLGTEAIRELEVENLPVIVVIDSEGNNLYETAIKEYSRV